MGLCRLNGFVGVFRFISFPFQLQSKVCSISDTLKELINAALISADRGLNLKTFCGTNFCGCLNSKHFATLIFADVQR